MRLRRAFDLGDLGHCFPPGPQPRVFLADRLTGSRHTRKHLSF